LVFKTYRNILEKIYVFLVLSFCAVPSWLSCPLCPVQADLSCQLVSPTCLGCPLPIILSQMSVRMSCQRCLVPDVLSQIFCPDCLPWLSHPSCPVLAVLSLLSCSGRYFLAVLFSLSYPGCTVLTVFSGCPIPAVRDNLGIVIISNTEESCF
jgi:hypothetical protein